MKEGDSMINTNLLKGYIAIAGHTQRSLSKKLGVSKNTLNSKINGRTAFDTVLIEKICDELNIDDITERAKIFLTNSSHNRDDMPKIR